MAVLVVYATAHGSTQGIAEFIARRLREQGLIAEARAADGVTGAMVEAAAAVVVGSAVHNGSWLAEAEAFARKNRKALAARPVWLFSVSSVGDEGGFFPGPVNRVLRKLGRDPRRFGAVRRATNARGSRNFAGAIERAQWPLSGHLFLRALGGRYGDHRNWDAIEAWADEIARSLSV